VKNFHNDRSQPDHVEALVALGEPERARRVLAWLEERGRVLPRLGSPPRSRAPGRSCWREGELAGHSTMLDDAPEVTEAPVSSWLARSSCRDLSTGG